MRKIFFSFFNSVISSHQFRPNHIHLSCNSSHLSYFLCPLFCCSLFHAPPPPPLGNPPPPLFARQDRVLAGKFKRFRSTAISWATGRKFFAKNPTDYMEVGGGGWGKSTRELTRIGGKSTREITGKRRERVQEN